MKKRTVLVLSILVLAAVLALVALALGRKYFPEYFPRRYRGTEILLLGNLPSEMSLAESLGELLRQEGLPFKTAEFNLPHAGMEDITSELQRRKQLASIQPRLVILLMAGGQITRSQQQAVRELAGQVTRHVNRDGSRPRLFPVTLPADFAAREAGQGRLAMDFNDFMRGLAQANDLMVLELAGLQSTEGFARELFNALLPFLRSFPPEAEERMPGGFQGFIVFQSDRSGTDNIYLLSTEGLRPLTANNAANESPFFSPDGGKVVYESNLSGRYELYVHDLDAGSNERLFPSPSEDRHPFWSQQGDIYFSRLIDGNEQIFRYSFTDGNIAQITDLRGRNTLPALSPAADRLLMTSNLFLGWHVYWFDLKDGSVSKFSADYGGCRARYNNSGNSIAWVSHKASGKGDIFITQADRFAPVRLTIDDHKHDYYPCFSPDDRFIVYASGPQLRSGNWDLKIMEISSRKTWQITSSPAKDILPCWR